MPALVPHMSVLEQTHPHLSNVLSRVFLENVSRNPYILHRLQAPLKCVNVHGGGSAEYLKKLNIFPKYHLFLHTHSLPRSAHPPPGECLL